MGFFVVTDDFIELLGVFQLGWHAGNPLGHPVNEELARTKGNGL